MDNFTPLKPVEKKKKRINKFLIFGNLFLVILVALIGIFYYNQTLQTREQRAVSQKSCNDITNKNECNDTCSPTKQNGLAFECKWQYRNDRCVESSVVCGSGGGGTGVDCPATAPINLPNGCEWEGDCCVPGGTSTGNPACQGYGPRLTYCQQGFECLDGFGCFPATNPSNPPNPTKTPTPTPPAVTNTPTPTRTPTPTQPIMSVCNETCSSSDLCFNEEPGPNELVCTAVGGGVSRCRNKACVTSPTCVCPTSTPTRTPTPTGTIVPSNTPTTTPTGTIVPSNTPTATPTTPPGEPTNTPGPTSTPIPVLCGTKDCDDATNPCRSGYDCVQANDGSNYCTSPDFTDACKANPSYNSCCIAPGEPTATPTEIVLAQTTITSPPSVPVTGMIQSFMYLIPVLIIFVGLIL